jgi:hypothetical protein
MKKLSILIAFLIAIGNLAFAQKGKKAAAPDIDVPTPVLKTFNTKYRLAKKVIWSQEEDNYRADFKLNDLNMATSYSADGKLLYTEKEMAKAQYNKTALKYITENYAGYKVSYMRKRDTYDKKTTYIAMLRKSREMLEVEFDKKGGFIRDADKTPVVASKKKQKKEAEDEEDVSSEDEDTPKKAEVKQKPKKGGDDDEEEDEEATPAPKKEKPKAAPAKKKTTDEDDEEEEEAKPEPKKEKAKPAAKPKKKTDDDEEDDE